ncbi:MAG: hypothetical protein ACOCXQ_01015 [Patescibacteria group bacterium]
MGYPEQAEQRTSFQERALVHVLDSNPDGVMDAIESMSQVEGLEYAEQAVDLRQQYEDSQLVMFTRRHPNIYDSVPVAMAAGEVRAQTFDRGSRPMHTVYFPATATLRNQRGTMVERYRELMQEQLLSRYGVSVIDIYREQDMVGMSPEEYARAIEHNKQVNTALFREIQDGNGLVYHPTGGTSRETYLDTHYAHLLLMRFRKQSMQAPIIFLPIETDGAENVVPPGSTSPSLKTVGHIMSHLCHLKPNPVVTVRYHQPAVIVPGDDISSLLFAKKHLDRELVNEWMYSLFT